MVFKSHRMKAKNEWNEPWYRIETKKTIRMCYAPSFPIHPISTMKNVSYPRTKRTRFPRPILMFFNVNFRNSRPCTLQTLQKVCELQGWLKKLVTPNIWPGHFLCPLRTRGTWRPLRLRQTRLKVLDHNLTEMCCVDDFTHWLHKGISYNNWNIGPWVTVGPSC